MNDIMDAKIGRIAKFLDIDKEDVKYATEPGGDLKLLGHFVAVDHESKSVVLAIRGTHNTSEWITDFDATAGKKRRAPSYSLLHKYLTYYSFALFVL